MATESPFTLACVLPLVARQTEAYLAGQITDHERDDRGAYLRPEWGLDDAGGTAGLLALCLWTRCMRRLHPHLVPGTPGDTALLNGAMLAADYLLRVQRPSGLTDLRDCNYDSSPDAGFILQALCPALSLSRCYCADAGWAEVHAKAERFARRMTVGAMKGGFHTPNHRWVIAGALAQVATLFPDIDVAPTIDAYLAEGFDVDVDGAWTERSTAVYDAICDRSMLLLAEHHRCAAAQAAAHANLTMDLHLLDADGAIETGLSRRQDYGTRTVPASLVAPLLLAGIREPNPVFVRAAEHLWNAAPDRRDAYGVAQVLLSHGEPHASTARLPDDFAVHYAANRLWRVRRGSLSASFFGGATRLMRLRFGDAELSSLKISQSYFGVGRFVADNLHAGPDHARLLSEGRAEAYRPGYEMPLGRAVDTAQWQQTKAEREIRRLPYATSELVVTEASQGFDLRYRTLDGVDTVPAQMALDFPPGGVWETDDCCLRPPAGQVLFLRKGFGTMRFGTDAIRVGPGADGHRMWQMRDAETAPGHVRILITFLTPVDHTLHLRGHRGGS